MLNGGSQGIRQSADYVRQGGAAAHTMVEQAAAQWDVAPSECRGHEGAVTYVWSGHSLRYGALAGAVGKLPAPPDVALKAPGVSTHGKWAAPEAIRGVSARYPQSDPALGRPVTLGAPINQCRARTGKPAWGPDSEEMLSVTALVGRQLHGLPVAIDGSGPAHRALEQGRALFAEWQGQLNLSCAQCHDDLAGQRLGGA